MKKKYIESREQKKGYDRGFLECDYCGEIFVEGEPFCPCCGKPAEEILEAKKKKQTGQ